MYDIRLKDAKESLNDRSAKMFRALKVDMHGKAHGLNPATAALFRLGAMSRITFRFRHHKLDQIHHKVRQLT